MKKAMLEMPVDEKERERQRQLRDAHERIGDLGRYINELEGSLEWERNDIKRLRGLLAEAGRYVSDAGNDEDPETQRLSRELMQRILAEIDPTAQLPR